MKRLDSGYNLPALLLPSLPLLQIPIPSSFLLAFFLFAPHSARAEPQAAIPLAQSTQASEPRILQTLQHQKRTYHQTEERRRSILSQLYNLNSTINKTQREQDSFSQRRERLETEIYNLAQVVNQLNRRIGAQRMRLARRMRILQRFGGQGTLQLIFTSQSTSDLEREMRVLKSVVGIDYESLRRFRLELVDRHGQQVQLAGQRNRLERLESNMQRRNETLVNQLRQKNELLAQLDSKQLLRVSQMRRLRLVAGGGATPLSRKLANLEAILQPSFIEKRGLLSAPFQGTLVEAYGTTSEATSDDDIRIRTHGVAWQSPHPVPVTVVSQGDVIFAGNLAGFGSTLIVDHGEHYYSVYSHLSETKVQIGQHLNEGENLGESERLYFEIRHFSESEDPGRWLRRP